MEDRVYGWEGSPSVSYHRPSFGHTLSGALLSQPSSWWGKQGARGHMLGSVRSGFVTSSLELDQLRGLWIILLFNFIKS